MIGFEVQIKKETGFDPDLVEAIKALKLHTYRKEHYNKLTKENKQIFDILVHSECVRLLNILIENDENTKEDTTND